MIISTPEELRLYLPTHVLQDLDSMQGFLDNSEADFLAERIGKPLLMALRGKYTAMVADAEGQGMSIADVLVNIDDSSDAWLQLLSLCQRCIVFDAFMRSADISAVSVNDAGLNIAESKGYEQAGDKTISNYKQQMSKEAHAASNRLLIQLEDWQKAMPATATTAAEEDIADIITLWKQSAYYYYADGLLFNTATEFGLYVNIYDSREKFIQLLPDIRYCQEVHIEAELGEALLSNLLDARRKGTLNETEQKAIVKLQRALSLQVEARSAMFKRPEAKDEAQGNLRLALAYIHKNQTQFNEEAMKQSLLYDAKMWSTADTTAGTPAPPPVPHQHHDTPHNGGMFMTSII